MQQLFRTPITGEHLLFTTRAHMATFECDSMADLSWLRVRVGKAANSQDMCLRIDICPKPGATQTDTEPSSLAYAKQLDIYLHPFQLHAPPSNDEAAAAAASLQREINLLDFDSYLVHVPAIACKTEPRDASEEDSETIERAWSGGGTCAARSQALTHFPLSPRKICYRLLEQP
jgi:hypothetical protein